MNNRVITRERGAIPGCKAAGSNYGMAVDSAGRPWSRSPSDIDAYLAKLRAETRQSRINRGADPETGIKIVALRSDLAPEQRDGSSPDRAHRIRQRGSEAQAEGSQSNMG